jgi:hypothetical protein
VYPAILCAVAVAFIVVLVKKQDADVVLLRGLGAPFVELEDGQISNPARLKIKNRSKADAAYTVEVVGSLPVKLVLDENPVHVAPGAAVTKNLLIVAPAELFSRPGARGKLDIKLLVKDPAGYSSEFGYHLMGPATSGHEEHESNEDHKEEGGRERH